MRTVNPIHTGTALAVTVAVGYTYSEIAWTPSLQQGSWSDESGSPAASLAAREAVVVP
jgi:hypothetical protein